MNSLDPARIEVRDRALKVQDGFMRKDNAIKIQYASKYASVANYWKKWIGEVKGLKKSNAVGIKQKFEKDLTDKINKAGKQAEYGNLLSDFKTNYEAIAPYALAREYYSEVVLRKYRNPEFCVPFVPIGTSIQHKRRAGFQRQKSKFNRRI